MESTTTSVQFRAYVVKCQERNIHTNNIDSGGRLSIEVPSTKYTYKYLIPNLNNRFTLANCMKKKKNPSQLYIILQMLAYRGDRDYLKHGACENIGYNCETNKCTTLVAPCLESWQSVDFDDDCVSCTHG